MLLRFSVHGSASVATTPPRALEVAVSISRSRPVSATLVVVPCMDHHFAIYPSLEDAFRAEGGFVSPQRPVMEIVAWLRSVVGAGG